MAKFNVSFVIETSDSDPEIEVDEIMQDIDENISFEVKDLKVTEET